MRPLLLWATQEELLSTKYGDYQLEEKREDANTVSTVIKK
jgi:hypothetical protein